MIKRIIDNILSPHKRCWLLFLYGIIMFITGMALNHIFGDFSKPVFVGDVIAKEIEHSIPIVKKPSVNEYHIDEFIPQKAEFSEYIYDITIKSGDTFTGMLAKAGVGRKERYLASSTLDKIYTLKNLRVGGKISIVFREKSDKKDNDGDVEFVSLKIDEPDREIELFKKDDGKFDTRIIKKALNRKLFKAGGVIKNNLYLLADSLNIPPNILSEAISAYSFDVDFQRDIRKGQRFSVFYEVFYDNKGNKVRTGDMLYASLTVGGKDMKIYRFSPPQNNNVGDADYYTNEGRSLRRTLLKTPIDGAIISSPFGRRKHPISGYTKVHKGTDFAAPRGTPIYAGGYGRITKIGRNGGYGNYIRIRHNKEFSTAYAHISRFARGMKKGRKVKQGQIIAYVGSTGASTGPHLHYEILRYGKQVNPKTINLPQGKKLNKKEMKLFEKRKDEIDVLRQSTRN